ncbi:spore-associated protein A [Nocardiopsis sp. NPDC058789]|uniref:spore-associated protein A n=1 Tax=Nocardiopsis sp. NPDC058789 TaxID=3346634 RepID=UPI00366B517B
MKNALRKTAAVALALGISVSGVFATAAPASAASAIATYGNECGSGYKVVNHRNIGSKGTVFLTYNSSNGNNCVVTKRVSTGAAVLMEAGLKIGSSGNHYDKYEGGHFTSYAGPIYLSAAGKCVSWMGRISGTEGKATDTNCG